MTYTKEERQEDMEQERMEDTKTELKTLKDLKIEEFEPIDEQDEFHMKGWNDSLENLKAEAIKWVKSCGCSYSDDFKQSCSRCGFIMYFFNLTKEEISSEEGK